MSTATVPPPDCPNGHGPMVLRSPQTPEQAYCGTWYDCAPGAPGWTCKSSVLIPSPEIAALHAADTKDVTP